jgi:hypothetical protein
MRIFRLLRLFGAVLVIVLAAIVVLALSQRHSLPSGQPGPEADALAHRIERAVNIEAWNRTGAVRFSFLGLHHYLWDRQRNLARVRFGDCEVLLAPDKVEGRAKCKGVPLEGEERTQAIDKAYKYFINDTFWLNPLGKLFDPGTSRALVQEKGRPALLLSFASGGVTPGDRYLWIVDEHGRPRAWRMWAKVLPIGGLPTTWEGWTTLPTGAQVATDHQLFGLHAPRISGLAAAQTLAELEPGPDPFRGF